MAKAQQLLRWLNAIPNEDTRQRFEVLRGMLGQIGIGTQIKSPFSCDSAYTSVLVAMGSSTMGACSSTVTSLPWDDAQIGPGVHIYTAFTRVDPEIRSNGLEAAKPVNIGHNVWFGGHCIILPV
jgi:maltose O-acetyltransferase